MAVILFRGIWVNKPFELGVMHATPSHYHNHTNVLACNEHIRWKIQEACVNACWVYSVESLSKMKLVLLVTFFIFFAIEDQYKHIIYVSLSLLLSHSIFPSLFRSLYHLNSKQVNVRKSKSSHDADEGKWNQNILYVSHIHNASQQSSCWQHHIDNSH